MEENSAGLLSKIAIQIISTGSRKVPATGKTYTRSQVVLGV
jgi:hypothetical protein